MQLTPRNKASQPCYPAHNRRRRAAKRLAHWCGRTIATGAALLTLSFSACSAVEEVRLAGGSVMPQLDDMELSYPPPLDGKPPQLAPRIVRDPRKPPLPGSPGHRQLPRPRRTPT